jgi:hypothetical protein
VYQLEVQGAKQQQGLDLAAAAVAVARRKVEEVVVVEEEEEQVGHWSESAAAAEAAEAHLVALVFCSEAEAAEAGQESRESDCELVEGAGAGVVRLVEGLFALEAVEGLAERSQQVEGVAEALEGGPPLVEAGVPHLVEMGIGARSGAGLFFGLVVVGAWCLCSVGQGPAVGPSLLQQLSRHLLYLTRTCSQSGSFAQSLS